MHYYRPSHHSVGGRRREYFLVGIAGSCQVEQIIAFTFFKYLKCGVSYATDCDVNNKILWYKQIWTINITFKRTKKEEKLQFHKEVAILSLLYGSETWVKKRENNFKIKEERKTQFFRLVLKQISQN
jgi:hypothetical protein